MPWWASVNPCRRVRRHRPNPRSQTDSRHLRRGSPSTAKRMTLRHLHGRIPPAIFKEHNRGLVPRGQYRHDGLRHVETLRRRLAPQIRRPLLQGLRHDDRPVRGLRNTRSAKRWLLDAYVLGWAWMDSHYNGYSFDGQVDMNPHRPVQPEAPPTRSTAPRSGIPTRSASRSGIASSRPATNSGQRTCAKQQLRTAAGSHARKVRSSGTKGSSTPGMRATGNSGRPGNLNPG